MIPFGGEIHAYIYRRKCLDKQSKLLILKSEWKENTSAFSFMSIICILIKKINKPRLFA